jgi:hypothetical protein
MEVRGGLLCGEIEAEDEVSRFIAGPEEGMLAIRRADISADEFEPLWSRHCSA